MYRSVLEVDTASFSAQTGVLYLWTWVGCAPRASPRPSPWSHQSHWSRSVTVQAANPRCMGRNRRNHAPRSVGIAAAVSPYHPSLRTSTPLVRTRVSSSGRTSRGSGRRATHHGEFSAKYLLNSAFSERVPALCDVQPVEHAALVRTVWQLPLAVSMVDWWCCSCN
jgi:hypothetical protein